jgi:TetR/AcrR family transcriptional repressor of nem operon
LLNTAIDSDDGNPQLRTKARRALRLWLERLQSIVQAGQQMGDVRSEVDSAKLATLIASTLEGSLMVSRLERNDEPLELACQHLEEFIETNVRTKRRKNAGKK